MSTEAMSRARLPGGHTGILAVSPQHCCRHCPAQGGCMSRTWFFASYGSSFAHLLGGQLMALGVLFTAAPSSFGRLVPQGLLVPAPAYAVPAHCCAAHGSQGTGATPELSLVTAEHIRARWNRESGRAELPVPSGSKLGTSAHSQRGERRRSWYLSYGCS